jgi:hypothetical protein
MPATGAVIEFKTGVRVEVVSAGTGRAARAGRTVVLHQRTFELPQEVAPAPESAPAEPRDAEPRVAEAPVAEVPSTEAAPAAAAESAPAAPESAPAVAEAAPAQPIEISSTWRGGVPLTAALGRGQLIEELEQALEGMRAGSRLQVRVPVRGTAPALEIEVELVEVR